MCVGDVDALFLSFADFKKSFALFSNFFFLAVVQTLSDFSLVFTDILVCAFFVCSGHLSHFLLNVIYLSTSRCQIDVEFQRKKSNNILHSDPFGRKMHSASFDTVIGQNWLLAHKIHYDIYQIRTLFKRDLPQSSTLWPGYFWMHDTFMIVTSCMSWS